MPVSDIIGQRMLYIFTFLSIIQSARIVLFPCSTGYRHVYLEGMEEASIFVHVAINDITGKVTFYYISFLFCINVATEFLTVVEGEVHFQNLNFLIIYSPPCHPRCSCVSSVTKKFRFLRKTFQDFSPYSGLQRALHNPSLGTRVLSS